ncbi:MAG: HIT domain-containing protein [Candidatus Eisenbacteria bacterium]|nr:HIT domain-containing protein [Candidatus Eisenbacteria bacterium]
MDRLWATWRMPYIDTLKEEEKQKKCGCFLCEKPKENKDEETCILLRGVKTFVILNMFPYNPGHLLIAPYRHVGTFHGLDDEERREILEQLALIERAMGEVFAPDGINMGVNIGRAAGAGVPGHIHFHMVPRWQGDCNFMPVLCDTKVIPQGIHDVWRRLREALVRMGEEAEKER